MTLMELTMIPLDKGASISDYVARTTKIIEDSGLDYRLGSMSTVVEGEWDALTALLTRCFRDLEDVCDRISVSVRFDHRKGYTDRIPGKIRSIEEKVGHSLKTG